ncbi:PepSY domain-containing protein [Qipengyuania sp. 1NDW9]|uniref:PepSY domain-containing protein n=2 Tax=Qipengyuania TaxID=1855416 RepID=A0A9Q3S1P1_9SPHN|nr:MULTISPECIES: PepSY domain-containing protein [Qipengyuania]MBX7492636.1 PepSY domain-containing protein [Qipengyuania xiapuensis]MBY6218190.1 PepSY domain-containing protein [Qipengyuania aquimaris]QZD93162.1 PepSY domain-containing protein [Qipengyuania xiapuensis]UOR15278.1 PepSY domain-containing protein [Qipengyuania aquimaris]
MKRVLASLLAFGLVAGPIAATIGAAPAEAQRRSDQGEARKEMRAGNILTSREIENRVLPSMRGAEYLGFDYDRTAMAYRLKFIRDGRVLYVDVDARTGRILRRSR